jgi:hypothetical protein
MNRFSTQLGLSTAAEGRWRSYANVNGNGGVLLRALHTHRTYSRIDSLATIRGELMT